MQPVSFLDFLDGWRFFHGKGKKEAATKNGNGSKQQS